MRADSFQPIVDQKPRMTLASLEEVRRRRLALQPPRGNRRAIRPANPLQESLLRPAAPSFTPTDAAGARGPAMGWLLAAAFLCSTAVCTVGWSIAAHDSTAIEAGFVDRVGPRSPQSATAAQHLAIEAALSNLRSGLPLSALSALRRVRAENAEIPSLDYLIALAAAQAGEQEAAREALNLTLLKGERISDALALRAALATTRDRATDDPSSGRGGLAAEALLREAINADPANAFPYFELAALQRARGDRKGATEMLESARLRLQPIDAHAAIDVSLRLLDLEQKNDAALPPLPQNAVGAADLLGAAYSGFRLGRNEEAVGFLRRAAEMLPDDLFAYLLADPAFAPYRALCQAALADSAS